MESDGGRTVSVVGLVRSCGGVDEEEESMEVGLGTLSEE
ncbi:hypothetical protein A2U01_0112883 [Trifolium medium]|uniref:Uncharacterized protein n=1 Tax=Trifolium medium TaxID=97028 RepID=A0A392VVT5_9FABA|nr:hypothetical protein [Trifolium medium]